MARRPTARPHHILMTAVLSRPAANCAFARIFDGEDQLLYPGLTVG
jgi:hypothetical protein